MKELFAVEMGKTEIKMNMPGNLGQAILDVSKTLMYEFHGDYMQPIFLLSKKRKGKQRKKERVSEQKLIKDVHQGQYITVLAILECLEFKNFSCRPTMMADNTFQCSMVPSL